MSSAAMLRIRRIIDQRKSDHLGDCIRRASVDDIFLLTFQCLAELELRLRPGPARDLVVYVGNVLTDAYPVDTSSPDAPTKDASKPPTKDAPNPRHS